MTWQVLQGDVREKLAEMEAGSVQTCVTSPPYWGLRDYGADGQLGLEPTPEEYTANMVEVFRGVKRVLRDDGTVWLNLGDSYAGSNQGVGTKNLTAKQSSNRGTVALTQATKSTLAKVEGCKPKDLVGIPWSVAFALRADGWYLRSDIIWHKPNPMPESVTDRPTKSHEYIFLLSKSQKYFYDAEAIKEPQADISVRRAFSKNNVTDRKDADGDVYAISGKAQNETYERMRKSIEAGEEQKRNKRTVWTVSTQPYPGAHFATFPPKLIEPCILAGTSPKACDVCGSPWVRVVEKKSVERGIPRTPTGRSDKPYGQVPGSNTRGVPYRETIGVTWQPTCTCNSKGTGRCKVLDPFAGSGTTLWVAETNGRDSVGIELNAEYIELINKRMDNMQVNLFMCEGVK